MSNHPLAGKPAPREILISIDLLNKSYLEKKPDISQVSQRVSFGTSGHRGSSNLTSFNENHILAIVQSTCDYRKKQNINGPLFLGMDTHALSQAAYETALEVLIANEVHVIVEGAQAFTPTPVISHAILTYNQANTNSKADGIIITPSHNPPEDGGIKYNPPHGGPADSGATQAIESGANELLAQNLRGLKRVKFESARASEFLHKQDLMIAYIKDLKNVVHLDAISKSGLKLGVDPMGGAAIHYWGPIAKHYGLSLEVVNPIVDPTFSFMMVDRDGKIRMDCSSSYAMAGLIKNKDRFDLCFANDPDVDRHGIVTKTHGLLNPNHYLSVAIEYLFTHRPKWNPKAAIGKTLVSSSMIDRVAKSLGRSLAEVPVGFKYFVDGLLDGTFGFGGEESAGASFLRHDGTVWTTDKDGIILNLLAAEMMAVTQKNPGELYHQLTEKFGAPVYERMDAPISLEQKSKLSKLSPDAVKTPTLAGDPITQKLTRSPHLNSSIGGLKVATEQGWFAARPSGTEAIYKIYAESFIGRDHLKKIQEEAQVIVSAAIA
jgi:phosphoglucomutase